MAEAGSNYPRFHLAIPVNNLAETRKFYSEILGCKVGRSAEKWIDFDFFGHQVSAHLTEIDTRVATNPVDGDNVPVRHFGAILQWAEWERLSLKLQSLNTKFIIEPHIRFKGEIGEQATMFFLDPSGNAIEFKSFKDESKLFAA